MPDPDGKARLAGLVAFVLLLGLACYNLFAGLSVQQVHPWDEARHIASALEMLRSGDYLVTTYQGHVDYWNLKPPLSVWASALGFRLLDNPFLGVRLFSGIAALIVFWQTCRLARRFSDGAAGLLAAALMVTAWPLFLSHAARTADPDMLMILAATTALLCFDRGTCWGIAGGYAALGVAFLAKSFHVVPYGTAAFLYTVRLQRQGRLSWRDVFLLPGGFLLPVLPWAVARYDRDGWRFLEAMLTYDVLKRAVHGFEVVQETSHWLYVQQLLWSFGFAGAVAVTLRLVAGRRPDPDVGRMLLPALWILIPLGMYSFSKTRLAWYIYPVFPAAAAMVAAVIRQSWPSVSSRWQSAAVILLALGMLTQESEIASCIGNNCFIQDAIATSITRLGAEKPSISRPTYLESDPGLIYQHYYATALMSGSVILAPGGAPAFASCRPPCWLIGRHGEVMKR